MDKKFSVTLINEKMGIRKTLAVGEDEFILDIADEGGLSLPYSCRAGKCFDCLGKVIEGKVEQTAEAIGFLKPDELKSGYVLLCASRPASDCQILTHQVEELFGDD